MPSMALSAATTSSKRPGSAAHAPEISAVSTTMPARHSGARAETSLRWPSQRSTSATSSGLAAGLRAALVVDDGQRGGQQGGVGLVEHDEHVGVGLLEVAVRLGLVVEAEHGRRGAPPQDPAAGLEAGGEGREAEGAALLGRRAAGGCGGGPR